MSDEQTQQVADDPSGPGWRDVEPDEILQDGDMLKNNTGLWLRTGAPGRLAREGYGGTYRRRIEPQQRFAQLIASLEQITKERDAMAAAYHDSCIRGEQVNAELQQLREQVATVGYVAGCQVFCGRTGSGEITDTDGGRQVKLRAMVLQFEPELGNSRWVDFVSRHRSERALIEALRAGVRQGKWSGWRLIVVIQEVLGHDTEECK